MQEINERTTGVVTLVDSTGVSGQIDTIATIRVPPEMVYIITPNSKIFFLPLHNELDPEDSVANEETHTFTDPAIRTPFQALESAFVGDSADVYAFDEAGLEDITITTTPAAPAAGTLITAVAHTTAGGGGNSNIFGVTAIGFVRWVASRAGTGLKKEQLYASPFQRFTQQNSITDIRSAQRINKPFIVDEKNEIRIEVDTDAVVQWDNTAVNARLVVGSLTRFSIEVDVRHKSTLSSRELGLVKSFNTRLG